MRRQVMLSVVLGAVLGSGLVAAEDGAGSVAEIIAARRGLMTQLASLQVLIDNRLGAAEDSDELYGLAQAAAQSLDAFAVLLPPQTNLLGGAPAIDGVQTTASAAIWEDLPAFRQQLRDVAALARQASEAVDLAGFRAEWDRVAAACASCHEGYVVFDPFAALN